MLGNIFIFKNLSGTWSIGGIFVQHSSKEGKGTQKKKRLVYTPAEYID